MKRFAEDSTQFLVILLAWYFFAYIGTGLDPKIFTKGLFGVPKIGQMENLYYSTVGGAFVGLILPVIFRWTRRFKSNRSVTIGPLTFPREYLYLAPSGVCTAIIIPGTNMMYSFGISVMIAMVMMRGCVIVIGRLVDAVQIRQGILKKRVCWQENVAVVIAIAAICTAFFKPVKQGENPFDLFRSLPAMVTLTMYVCAYAVRIYIMNWYKNTEKAGDNRAFFVAEQGFAAATLVVVVGVVLLLNTNNSSVLEIQNAANTSNIWPIIGGMAFGFAAIPSVFLMMFKGRTATFATLANRLTSLAGGTVSTVLLALMASQEWPSSWDWGSFGLVVAASGFLFSAEKRYKQEREEALRRANLKLVRSA